LYLPTVTHVPCDLNQQRKRRDARRDSIARAVAWRSGRRTLLDRILRRKEPTTDLAAAALLRDDGEDVFHSLRF
jgi:hypothetical protein